MNNIYSHFVNIDLFQREELWRCFSILWHVEHPSPPPVTISPTPCSPTTPENRPTDSDERWLFRQLGTLMVLELLCTSQVLIQCQLYLTFLMSYTAGERVVNRGQCMHLYTCVPCREATPTTPGVLVLLVTGFTPGSSRNNLKYGLIVANLEPLQRKITLMRSKTSAACRFNPV